MKEELLLKMAQGLGDSAAQVIITWKVLDMAQNFVVIAAITLIGFKIAKAIREEM